MNTITIEQDQGIPALEEILVPDEDTKTPFTIDSLEKAAWAARKVLGADGHSGESCHPFRTKVATS